MNDNLPANVQLDSSQNGSVSFATEVIATIAGLAANEVEGVASMHGGSSGGFADILGGRKNQGSRGLTKGVKIELDGGKLNIGVSISVDYGFPIPDVAKNIQENIKKAVETMSGLSVASVNVSVLGLSFEKENRAAAEIEQQQRLLLQKQSDSAIGGEMAAEPDADAAYEDEEDGAEYELDMEDIEDE